MNQIPKNWELHLLSVNDNIESSKLDSHISKFRTFIAGKISNILENKWSSLLYASAFATALTAVGEFSQSLNRDNKWPEIIATQNNSITNNSTPDTLGSVDVITWRIDIDKKLISEQAAEYFLDEDILLQAIEQNELWSLKFIEYVSEEDYNLMKSDFSYRQLWEALWDLQTLEYLINQQYTSEETKIAAQRIFNELLRNKQYIKSNQEWENSEHNKYDLILAAAEYNYQFILWESYDEKSMIAVTNKIDNWEYDLEILQTYADEFKTFIEYNAWFNINQYENYLASISKTEIIANNSNEKREKY